MSKLLLPLTEPEARDRERQNHAGPRARPVCWIGRVAPDFSDRRNRRKKAVAHPDGESPDRANAHKTLSELSSSGPTGNPERSPLSIWNSPKSASGLAFGKAASRPVKPARGSASRFTPPPHHLTGFRKCSLRRKSAPPKTSISVGRENADKAGRLPRPPLSFPAKSPINPGRRMENHRESLQPSGRAAQNRMVERRRKTRQKADRLRRPAREPKPWRSSAGRPPREPKERTTDDYLRSKKQKNQKVARSWSGARAGGPCLRPRTRF